MLTDNIVLIESLYDYYFEGDDYLDEDTGSSDPGAVDTIIPLNETENGMEGIFDIKLDIDPDQKAINVNYPISGNRIQNIATYPNPFNSHIEIQFDLTNPSHVLVSVYDITGRWVQTITNKFFSKGRHSFLWNGKTSFGETVPSGEYFIHIQTANEYQLKSITFLK